MNAIPATASTATGSLSDGTATGPVAADATAQARYDAEQKELDWLRDRLDADEVKSADVLSTTVRTVATGLTLITYTFLTADKPSPFVMSHFDAMRLASVLGLLALAA